MITKIAHVCLNVCDLQKSIDFYINIGGNVRFEFKRNGRTCGAYLELAPGCFIEIFETAQVQQSSTHGIAHFCLETDDIDGFVAQCAAKKIPVTPKKRGCDNTWQVWLKDPDGNNFEVHQYTEQSSQNTGKSVEVDW